MCSNDVLTLADTKKKGMLVKDVGVIPIGWQNSILREVFGNVLQVVDKFKDFGDTLAATDPIHIGLPWPRSLTSTGSVFPDLHFMVSNKIVG